MLFELQMVNLLYQHNIFFQYTVVLFVEVPGVVSKLLVKTLDLVLCQLTSDPVLLHDIQRTCILLGLLEHPNLV